MSGSTIGGVVGGFVGFFVGGPVGAQIGFALGSAVGGYIDPQVLQGPKLGDIPVQTSQEGAPRPIVYGTPPPFPGNIIQVGPKNFSTKKTRQGKGGPVIESEEVHQTYAIRICEGPAICLKMWRDGKLVFDRSGTAFFDADSSVFSSKVVVYTGDETQMPSPALEALPATYGGGVGNVPAYRGTAYMVIENDNLTGTGGRIPNFEFLMSSNATIVEDCVEEGLVAWWPLSDASSEGTAAEIVGGKDAEYSFGISSGGALSYGSSGSMLADENTEYASRHGEYGELAVDTYVNGWTQTVWCKLSEEKMGTAVVAINYNEDFSGSRAWGIHLQDMVPIGGYGGGAYAPVEVEGDVPIGVGSSTFLALRWTPENGGTLRLSVNASVVDTLAGVGYSNHPGSYVQFGGHVATSSHFPGQIADCKLYNYALSDAELLERYVSTSEPFYETPDASGIWVSPDGSVHTFCPGRATTSAVYLSDIELDIADRCGLASWQFDVSEVVNIEVEGFLIGKQMSGAAALQPLANAYFHDLPEYDLQIHARRRGHPSAMTISDDDFVDTGEDDEVRAQAIELPRKLNLYFADPAANYAVVPVPAERTSGNFQGTSVVGVQLPLSLNRDVGKQKAEIMLRCIHEEAQGRLERQLPAYKYAQLVASDAITVSGKRWRIDTLEQLEGTIKIEGKRDRIRNYTSNATANEVLDPHDPVSSLKGPSLLRVMNLPRLRTQDDTTGAYLAVTGVLPAWPGAHIYLSTDGGVTEELVATITARATLGQLDADIDTNDEPISTWIFDNRDLESITEADLVLRRNAFAIITDDIAEIGQFLDADETVTNNHWDLTGTYRGLLGTDAALHYDGDDFVMLDGAIQFLPLSASLMGRTLIFRAVTIGTPVESNATTSFVFAPLFTGPAVIDYYTNAAGEPYTGADGAMYYKET